ncbi:MAG TPA: glycosyltransferase [Pyrinomonadaceae bacterium]|nr:glycosyltransferase [Pyrinomonadaceae bacterium]
MKPLVSAIIPNYNYARYVGEAVESALSQTYPNIEVIVVDDGSKDNSLKVLEKYRDRVKIIEQVNSGVCVARNRGVAESAGEYIAFLDADDVWLPAKIERQVEKFASEDVLGLVHVGVTDIDALGKELATHLDGMEGDVASELMMFESAVILGGGSGVMIPRKVFDKVGGFDDSLSTSADWDIYFRISSSFPVGFVDEPLLKYRLHGSNMHSNIKRMEHEMLFAYRKGFAASERDGKVDEGKAYGGLFRVLAGSYFRAGKYGDFLRTAVKSVWYRPAGIGYFAAFPLRRLRKQQMNADQRGSV